MKYLKTYIALSTGIWAFIGCKMGRRIRNRILFKALYNQVTYNNYDTITSLEIFYTPVDALSTVIDLNKLTTAILFDLENTNYESNN